jgi:hypothetical protein
MAIATSTAIAIGTSVVAAGASAKQASTASGYADKALKDSRDAYDRAMNELTSNKFAALNLPTEAYEREREAMLSAGQQATSQAAEGEGRGVAATAGRVQMAQQAGQREIAGAMGQDLMKLEGLTAQEEARLSEARANLELEQAAGAQAAAAQFGAQKDAAITGAISSLASAGQQYMQGSELFKEQEGAREFGKLKKEYDKAVELGKVGKRFQDAQGNVLPFEDALTRVQAPNVDLSGAQSLKGTQVTDYFVKRPSVIKSLLGTSFEDDTLFQPSVATSANKFMPSASGANSRLRFNAKPFGS